MLNFLLIPLGATLLVVGLVSYPTPLPGSTIVTTTGLGILLVSSPWFRLRVRAGRGRWRRLDGWMHWLEGRSKGRIAEALQETRPRAAEPAPVDEPPA